jgi:hypothetical protein
MNFEVSGVPPEVHHLADVIMVLRLEDQHVAGVGAQAAEDTDGLETGGLSSLVPPFARFFDYLRAARS